MVYKALSERIFKGVLLLAVGRERSSRVFFSFSSVCIQRIVCITKMKNTLGHHGSGATLLWIQPIFS